MHMLFDGSYSRAVGTNLDRQKIMVTFTHWQKDRTGFSEYHPLKSAEQMGFGHLSILTSHNDWYLNSDLPELMATLSQFTKDRKVIGIGFSMGGYGALRLSDVLRLKRAILVSPQFSIVPEKIPFDQKNRDLSQCDLSLDDLSNARSKMRGFVLYDPQNVNDRKHARKINEFFPRMNLKALSFGGHPATKCFSQGNAYGRMINAFLENTLDMRMLYSLHREAREASLHYEEEAAKYLFERFTR